MIDMRDLSQLLAHVHDAEIEIGESMRPKAPNSCRVILRLRSCKSMDAFVISSLPSPMLETLQMAVPLRSADITPLHRYYGPSRHPLVFGRLPGFAGYTA